MAISFIPIYLNIQRVYMYVTAVTLGFLSQLISALFSAVTSAKPVEPLH
jgi:hypothetical protein